MARTSIKSIVVAIGDPYARKQLALAKAVAIARQCRGRLTLVHAFSLPYPLPDPMTVESSEQLIDSIRTAQQQQLQKLVRPLIQSGLDVKCEVVWDFPVHDAIVRFVSKHKPDLLVVASHRHGILSRWLLANTDWELIRSCPCPLWFVKTPRLPTTLNMVAAVDPLHAHAKPAELDQRILDFAHSIERNFDSQLSLCHAYAVPNGHDVNTTAASTRSASTSQRARIHAAQAKKAFVELAIRSAVAPRNRFLESGEPAAVIPKVARKVHAHAVIMGAVSRSAVGRAFIGTTAEKVIDHLACDVIIIKPAGFKTAVSRRPAALKF